MCVYPHRFGAHLLAEEAAPVTSNPIEDIHGYDQCMNVEAVPMVHTYGTYGLGLDLTATQLGLVYSRYLLAATPRFTTL